MVAVRSLNDLISGLKLDFGLSPVMATEIEFYAHGITDSIGKEKAVAVIAEAVASAQLPFARADAEVGLDQFEVSFLPSSNVSLVIETTERFKSLMQNILAKHGAKVNFAAKPLADQPGSGLHIHLHLQNAEGKNVFTRAGDEMNAPFSPQLLHCLGGMLELMNPCMKFFAPTEASYARFVSKSNAPLTVSWGTNNRTVALRLPSKALDNKHIEHRVAGSDADVVSVISAVLMGAHYGLTYRCNPGDPIYGDASLPQYKLPLLATSQKEAEQFFCDSLTI